jgi:uncharacterized protein YndB with AHSA1/START domain
MADLEDVEAVVAVERTDRFPVSAQQLWDAVTDPGLLEEWFGPVDFDLTPGGAITEPDADGSGATIGVVETVEPGRRLGFVWVGPGSDAPSAVEIVLDDDGSEAGDGSVLHVSETLIRPRWETRPAWFPSSPLARAGARA